MFTNKIPIQYTGTISKLGFEKHFCTFSIYDMNFHSNFCQFEIHQTLLYGYIIYYIVIVSLLIWTCVVVQYIDQSIRCFHEKDSKGNCSDTSLVEATGSVTFPQVCHVVWFYLCPSHSQPFFKSQEDPVDNTVLVSPQQVQIKLRLGT